MLRLAEDLIRTAKAFPYIGNKTTVLRHILRPNPLAQVEYRIPRGLRLSLGCGKEDRTALFTVAEIFGEQMYRIPLHSEPKTILDLGANVGVYSLYAAVNYKHAMIYAIEPDETNFLRLQENIARNGLERRIVPFRVAASSKFGEVTLYRHAESSRGHSLVRTSESSITVKAMSLGELLDYFEIGHCDIVKMDIEGAEYDVLLSCPTETLTRIENFVIEYHDYFPDDPKQRPSYLFSFLREQGFTLKQHHRFTIHASSAQQRT